MFIFEETKQLFLMTRESRTSVTYEKQGRQESNSDYFEKIKSIVEAFVHNCGLHSRILSLPAGSKSYAYKMGNSSMPVKFAYVAQD